MSFGHQKLTVDATVRSLTVPSDVNFAQVKVETADGTEIMRISKDEFAFFPHYAGGAGIIQLEATANTVQVEYAYFTRS